MPEVKIFALLTLLVGAMAIQNDKTSLKSSSSDDLVLSASTFYTGPERTSDVMQHDESHTFHKTLPAFKIESSRSVDHTVTEETRFVFKNDHRDSGSIDELVSSKHVDQIDGNNIEVKPGEYYRITPTTITGSSGEVEGAPQGEDHLSEPHQLEELGSSSRPRFPETEQPRMPRQETSRIYSDHAPPPSQSPSQQTSSSGQRQANPDIQDIITGIVKLLNGNVNVAANTVRPHRPVQATRINNRGPPRISDVPPLDPDFYTPGLNPPPPPSEHPYPFEKPAPPEKPGRPFLNGVPLPEQIVPQSNRPWNWNRPGSNARPIPPYKPLPALDSIFHKNKENPSGEEQSEKPGGKPEISTQAFNSTSEDRREEVTPSVVGNNADSTTDKNNNDGTRKPQKNPSRDKIKSDDTLILGIPNESTLGIRVTSYLSSPKPVIPLDAEVKVSKGGKPGEAWKSSVKKNDAKSSDVTKTIDSFPTTTLNIETSSSVQVIEPTTTNIRIETTATSSSVLQKEPIPSSVPASSQSSTIILEPSTTANYEISTSATPTEGLPVSQQKISSSIEKNFEYTSVSSPPTYSKNSVSVERHPYRPRPGIVLDDTLDYAGSQGLATQRPYAPPRHPPIGDIFDVTVSAIQGPGGNSGESVRVPVNGGGSGDVILTSAVEGQGFVSIDGKRTYLNLFDNTDSTSGSSQPQPTRTQPPSILSTAFAGAQPEVATSASPRPTGSIRRPTFHRRPTQPPVRIDTCIVGDTSTCDASQHEACATVQGVSACHCKPGYARLQHSLPCKKIISIVVSIRVDKIYDRKVVWDRGLSEKDSESYQTLAYEANRAIESAMSMTPFSDEYMGSSVNAIYQGDVSQGQGGVFVNATLKLTYEPRTARPSLAGELQRHLLGVIHRRNNNIGNSALYVDSPPGSISNLQDLDECASSELNDCHSSAVCSNNWGGFTCTCNPGLKDRHKDDPNQSGRMCLSCPSTYCNNRGTCSYQGEQMTCTCAGNYYGTTCEIDGEVLGVAIGASVAALIIIVLTLTCLVMWSRRWSREQKAVGSPVYGYIQGGIPGTLPGTLARVGSVGTLASVKQGPPSNMPPYMWAHFGDHIATANLYATEPMGPTRPSSAMYGYPPISMHGTLPPVPLPRLQAPPRPRQRHQPDPDSSDSEPQDKDRADLIPQTSGFHVPRPKSRSSLANQSGIYNDVEYDQGDVHHLSKNNIPMSTYRPYYRT
ncbi:uncharacterized protein pwn [Prorops nasuta]|uniref:uncharacterized protein pwn n=1 Tax=Prorops nasuta TaxID=863751 RepID=UPI0034CD21C6